MENLYTYSIILFSCQKNTQETYGYMRKKALATIILGCLIVGGSTYWILWNQYRQSMLDMWEDKWSRILGTPIDVDPALFDEPVWQGNTTRDPRPSMRMTILTCSCVAPTVLFLLYLVNKKNKKENRIIG